MVEVIGMQSDVLGPISIFNLTLYVSEVLLGNGTLEILYQHPTGNINIPHEPNCIPLSLNMMGLCYNRPTHTIGSHTNPPLTTFAKMRSLDRFVQHVPEMLTRI